MYNQPHAQFLPQCQRNRLYIEKEAHVASLDMHGGNFVDKDKEALFNVAYSVTDNISS